MKRRIISVFLCLCMAISLLPSAALAATSPAVSNTQNEPQFGDVSKSDWFYDAVTTAVSEGLFKGTGTDTFDPHGTMSRGMYVTILGRIAGIDPTKYTGNGGFSDISDTAYYAPYVVWAVNSGITQGTGDNAFSPDGTVTREQMAAFIVRYFEVNKIEYTSASVTTEPSDIDSVSSWARDSVLKLWKAGLILGDDKGNVNPKANAVRAEAAAFCVRAYTAVLSQRASNNGDRFYTLRYNTNGGEAVNDQQVIPGKPVSSLPVTSKAGSTFLGWYTDAALSNPFYAANPVTSSQTLYAKFADLAPKEQFLDDTFTLTEQAPDLSFTLFSSDASMTSANVKSALTLENTDGSAYVGLSVSGSGGTFTVSADGGFTAGASYKLTLGSDSLCFSGKASSYRMCTFTIHKDEVMKLKLKDDITYIPSGDISAITCDGDSVDSLSVALLGNKATIIGSFTYNGVVAIAVGSTLCVYTGVNPNDRNVTDDYTDSPVAYVEVTSVSGSSIAYKSLDETNAEKIIDIPDTLPIDTTAFATDELNDDEFTVPTSTLNFSAYTDMGLSASTTVDEGDFMVFFTGTLATDTDVSYGKVDTVSVSGSNTTIDFEKATAADIKASMDYYTTDETSGEVLLKGVDVAKLEGQIADQAKDSGFAESAMIYLASVASKTDGFKKTAGLDDFTVTDKNGDPLDSEQMKLMGTDVGFEFENDSGVTVSAHIYTDPQHFKSGVGCTVTISGEFSMDVNDDSEITVNLSASFTEEVNISYTASGGAVWSYKWGWLPYISDYQMSAKVNVYDYTGISVQAKVATHAKDDNSVIDFTDFDITEELKGLLGLNDGEELNAGVQNLFKTYGEMLQTDTDYIKIVNVPLFKCNGYADPFHIIAYHVEADFVISANINVWLGADFDYMSGTQYNFWFKIRAKDSGSSSMDLMDTTYDFDFYVMGAIGLRAGINLEFAVGLFSTDLDSVGLNAEAGAYVELYGYFIYELHSVRAAGQSTSKVTSNMAGALYLEFGIYLNIGFQAQAGHGKFSYSPTLYDHEWPLLYAGTEQNVYDFAYDKPGDDDAEVIRDVTTYTLPESYRNMACLDLKTGDLSSNEYPTSKYYYTLSNKNFALDEKTGLITVTVPGGVQYLSCDLTLTWKSDKLAFSKVDLTRTIHLVWTNLTSSELKEKYAVSVRVGNSTDGYTTVWSTRVIKGAVPVLPTEDDIRKLIGYTKYVSGSTNLKYSDSKGYNNAQNNVGADGKVIAAAATGDQIYTFDASYQTYTLTVDGVQNADGSTGSKDFKAKFGEKFDLFSLTDTGTNIPGTTYTTYLKTACSDSTAKAADSVINTDFAVQLMAGTKTYTAKYVDNACTVTYKFNNTEGVGIDSVSEIIKKGTVPTFDYSAYLLDHGTGCIVKSWDKPIGKVSGDTTFTAVCDVPAGKAENITFESNGGSDVAPMPRYAGAMISAPQDPTRIGYAFAGWYSDAGLINSYTFDTMPDESFTLYARWRALTYTVTFNPGEGTLYSQSDGNKSVTYDAAYGTLPVPTRTSYNFDGWFTSLDGGSQVSADTTVSITAAQTLYPHWTLRYDVTGIDLTPQTYTYNKAAQPFTINGTELTGFTVQYKLNGKDSYTDSAVNAGTYTVRITRAVDKTYNAYTYTESAGLVINKADRNITVDLPTFISATFSSITVVPETVPNGGDGTMMYAASTSNTAPSSGWTTSTTIGGLSESTNYYVFAKVAGGDNYLDAVSEGTSKDMRTTAKSAPSISTDWYIQTGTDSGAGTDSNVSGEIYFADGSRTGSYGFNNSGDDFENSDYDEYHATFYRDPWMVSGVNIGNDGAGASSGWQCSYIDFTLWSPERHQHTFDVNNNWFDNQYSDYSANGAFSRTITSAGSFDAWGSTLDLGSTVALDSTSKDSFSLAYDGTVTDQYGTYNSYDKEDAPVISVSPSSSEYGNCYSYSNYGFTLNKETFYNKMLATGDSTVTFTITLSFPTRSSKTAAITKTVTVTRS